MKRTKYCVFHTLLFNIRAAYINRRYSKRKSNLESLLFKLQPLVIGGIMVDIFQFLFKFYNTHLEDTPCLKLLFPFVSNALKMVYSPMIQIIV